MMKCEEVQEMLGEYWDLPPQDELRLRIDEHIEHCASCRQEFMIWKESTELIRNQEPWDEEEVYPEIDAAAGFSDQVMKRIYQAESWRIPMAERIYAIPGTLRRNLTVVFALCMSLFAFGFIFALLFDHTPAPAPHAQGIVLQDIATAPGTSDGKLSLMYATASISEPILLHTGFIHTYPDYLLVLSLLGFSVILMIMNWINSIRS